jgi:hypothetical protein
VIKRSAREVLTLLDESVKHKQQLLLLVDFSLMSEDSVLPTEVSDSHEIRIRSTSPYFAMSMGVR